MKIKPLISKIVAYWKLISAVIGIAGTLVVGKAKYDSWVIGRADEKKIEISRWQKIDQIVEKDSTDRLFNIVILDSLKSFSVTLNRTRRMTAITGNALEKHLQNEKKWQERLDFQQAQIEELKKNEGIR